MTDPRMTPTNDAPVTVEPWRTTGRDKPVVEQRHRDAAAWAMDRAPDSLTWEKATAAHVTPDRLWQMNRVAEAMARMERDTIARHRLAALASASAGGGVEALRALSDAATAGPWSWEQCGEKEDVPVVGIAYAGDDPDCKAPYEGQFRDSDAARMTIAYGWQSCDGHSPSSNAAFAVAAVNYVRAALARPRAAVGERDTILEQAAQEAYRVCAETRHVTLGDKARAAILALQSPPAKMEGA